MRLSHSLLLLLFFSGLIGCGDDTVTPPRTPRVYHASPDGTGSDCETPQDCLDMASPGDTVELAAGIYESVAETLQVPAEQPPFVAGLVARNGVVLRGALNAQVRIDGKWEMGRAGVFVPEGVSEFTVSGIRFDNCDPGIHVTGGSLRIENCTFVTGSRGLVAIGTDLEVQGCRFEEYSNEAIHLWDCSGRIRNSSFRGDGYFVFAGGSRDLRLEDLLMAYACFSGIRVEAGGSVTARGLTVLGCGMVPGADSSAVVVTGGARLNLEQSILTDNRGFGILCHTGGVVSVTCSNLFSNSAGNYAGCSDPTGSDGNLAVDPRYCSFPDGDFHLVSTSPLRSAPCGPMGVYGDSPCTGRLVPPAAWPAGWNELLVR